MDSLDHNKVFRCSNGHLAYSRQEPTESCEECGSDEWELQIVSWPVLTEPNGMRGQTKRKITIHNGNDLCGHASEKGDQTDLETAGVGRTLDLCQHCSWPDEVREYVANQQE